MLLQGIQNYMEEFIFYLLNTQFSQSIIHPNKITLCLINIYFVKNICYMLRS